MESKEIYDENGNNITDWFNQKYKSLYNEGNKEAIVNDLYNKNYRYVADDAHEELSKARTGGSSQKKVYNSTQTVNTSLGFIKYQSYAILYISNSSNKITSYTVYVILKSNETGCKKVLSNSLTNLQNAIQNMEKHELLQMDILNSKIMAEEKDSSMEAHYLKYLQLAFLMDTQVLVHAIIQKDGLHYNN